MGFWTIDGVSDDAPGAASVLSFPALQDNTVIVIIMTIDQVVDKIFMYIYVFV
jgi:hypothetical protein